MLTLWMEGLGELGLKESTSTNQGRIIEMIIKIRYLVS